MNLIYFDLNIKNNTGNINLSLCKSKFSFQILLLISTKCFHYNHNSCSCLKTTCKNIFIYSIKKKKKKLLQITLISMNLMCVKHCRKFQKPDTTASLLLAQR